MDEKNRTEHPDISGLKIDREEKSSSRSSRAMIIAISLAVVAALAAISIFFLVRAANTAVVDVAPVRRAASAGGAGSILDASGYVTPRRRATVAAKITGRVSEMLIEEGMKVDADQVLARLDPSEYQAQLNLARSQKDVADRAVTEAEVSLADAERTLWRNRELREKGFVTQEDLDRASTAMDLARARLASARSQVESAGRQIDVAQKNLDNCTVRSPFAGVAVSKDAQIGEIVSPVSAGGGFTRTGISTIVDMQSLEIEVDVNESYIARVSPDQPVDAVLDAYPDWHIPAKVRTTIPTADRQKATVKVRISFNQLDPRILPDMGVKVSFLRTTEEGSAVAAAAPRTLVPKEAVQDQDGKKVVFVIRDDRVECRAVTTGLSVGSDIEVLAGISEGDQVVVHGPENLKDGQRVNIAKK